jgi:2-polyprenyl-3-methyl-5-hydroxy-6-metoxy-1,4-benzoquinol methylase
MKENEIRPEALYKRYIELSQQDAELCFGDKERVDVLCVACGSEKKKSEFIKHGFQYVTCLECNSLYQSPRPSLLDFESFYKNSVSSNYWADIFFPAVAEVRREVIFRSRVEQLSTIVANSGDKIEKLVDVGAGYGIFLDEWRKHDCKTELIAVEPSESLAAECRNKGFETSENICEEVEGYDGFADLVVCFEVLEHVFDPLLFVQSLTRLARPGGLVFLSTLSIDGFDLQFLWDKSNQISPPHHINFLSVDGFKKLFKRAGLTDISVTTPGKLDVDIIRNSCLDNIELVNGQRFIKKLIDDSELRDSFQAFLAENTLSSHAWIIGRLPL